MSGMGGVPDLFPGTPCCPGAAAIQSQSQCRGGFHPRKASCLCRSPACALISQPALTTRLLLLSSGNRITLPPSVCLGLRS